MGNKDDAVMEDDKTLADYGLTNSLAKAQSPAKVGLAFAGDGGVFEDLEKTVYSSPPELPDVMKPGQEASTQETTTTLPEFFFMTDVRYHFSFVVIFSRH